MASANKRGFLGEWSTMLRAFRKDHIRTGSVMPSSRFLGRELAVKLKGDRPACRILEVGPGTGPVTAEILKVLHVDDQLDICEINPEFVAHLQKRFSFAPPSDPATTQPQHIRLIQSGVEAISGTGLYQHIISGLPLNNFSPPFVEEIFSTFLRLLKPGGTISFFEYIALRNLKKPFVGKAKRQDLQQIGTHIQSMCKQHQGTRRSVLRNVPPAWVYHLKTK